jgi:hypothetical protein
VHLLPQEGDLCTSWARTHLKDLQFGRPGRTREKQLQVEHPRLGRQRPDHLSGELADRDCQFRIVQLHGSKRDPFGEFEAGVQITRGPPYPQAIFGGHTVDVQDVVRQIRLHQHRNVPLELVCIEVLARMEADHSRARRSAHGFDQYRPAVDRRKSVHSRVVRGRFRGGHGNARGSQFLGHDELIPEGGEPLQLFPGYAKFLPQFGCHVEVDLVQRDDTGGLAQRPGQGRNGGAHLLSVLGAAHGPHRCGAFRERVGSPAGRDVADVMGAVIHVGRIICVTVAPPMYDYEVVWHFPSEAG